MSLEELIRENTEAVRENTETLKAVLAGATGSTGGSAPAETKKTEPKKTEKADTKKTEPKKTEKADAGDEITFDVLKEALAEWLGEFVEGEDQSHPEIAARKAALKETLGKLKVEKLGELDGNPTDIGRLHKWLQTKAKTADNGFGVGRFAADPEEGGDAGSSLDDL